MDGWIGGFDRRSAGTGRRGSGLFIVCASPVLYLLVVPDGMYTQYVHTTQSTESNGGDWKK